MSGWIKWNGASVEKQFTSASSNAVLRALEDTGKAADQQVPHDEGTLQGTKTILQDSSDPLIWYIGYGGGGVSGFPKVPYAIRWHETPANFQKGRKHNYLRDPVKTVLPGSLKRQLNSIGLK